MKFSLKTALKKCHLGAFLAKIFLLIFDQALVCQTVKSFRFIITGSRIAKNELFRTFCEADTWTRHFSLSESSSKATWCSVGSSWKSPIGFKLSLAKSPHRKSSLLALRSGTSAKSMGSAHFVRAVFIRSVGRDDIQSMNLKKMEYTF